MATNAASALAAGNAGEGGGAPAGEQQQQGQGGGDQQPWFKAAGIDPKYEPAITAKGWSSPNDLLESYTNVEKLVSLERGGDVDRIIVKPKDGATPEEVAQFRAKAGFAAPAAPEDYGFTPEQIAAAPVIGEAAKWFHAAGIPKDVAGSLMEQVTAYETQQVEAFKANSDREYTALGQELGDKFGDFEEAGRRAFKASGLEPQMLDKIEQAVGTKAMMTMFAKFGSAMTEAAAPQPGKTGGGQFAQSAEQAQARITTLSKDSDFQAKLLSTNPEVRKSAQAEWENLFKTAYPSA